MKLSFIPDLKMRYQGPELMDDSKTDYESLFKTLSDLSIINRLISRSFELLRTIIFEDIRRRNLCEVNLMDVGCGGGDIDIWAAKHARKAGIRLNIIGIDHDQKCIDYAMHQCSGYPEIFFIKTSAFRIDKLPFKPDYIFANHFLHHLEDFQIPKILKLFCSKAEIGFLINDLQRSPISYFLFFLLRCLFSGREMTWHDGLLSIRKGFSRQDISSYLHIAQLSTPVHTRTIPPGRIVISNIRFQQT